MCSDLSSTNVPIASKTGLTAGGAASGALTTLQAHECGGSAAITLTSALQYEAGQSQKANECPTVLAVKIRGGWPRMNKT